MMGHLSISADDDVQQTLSFFEKIQARRGGLNLLVSETTSFRYLIESFPRLLILRLESRVKPIIIFLEDIGVPKECIRNILLLFPPILTYDINNDIKPRLHLFEKVPRVCSSEAIKSWPHILGCSVNKLKLMVEELYEMDIKNKKLGHVIATSPQLLLRKPQEFLQVVAFFKDVGMEEDAISRTVSRCPEIFAASIDKTLEKKLQFLYSIGISKPHIPEVFVCDVDKALLPRMNGTPVLSFTRLQHR